MAHSVKLLFGSPALVLRVSQNPGGAVFVLSTGEGETGGTLELAGWLTSANGD